MVCAGVILVHLFYLKLIFQITGTTAIYYKICGPIKFRQQGLYSPYIFHQYSKLSKCLYIYYWHWTVLSIQNLFYRLDLYFLNLAVGKAKNLFCAFQEVEILKMPILSFLISGNENLTAITFFILRVGIICLRLEF